MIRTIVLSPATAAAVTLIPAISVRSADQEATPSTQAFLKKSAEMHCLAGPCHG